MEKMMKDDAINLSGLIQKASGEPFTEEEFDAFGDAFIEWIESRQEQFGGGWSLVDADDEFAVRTKDIDWEKAVEQVIEQNCDDCGEQLVAVADIGNDSSQWAEVNRNGEVVFIHLSCIKEGDTIA